MKKRRHLVRAGLTIAIIALGMSAAGQTPASSGSPTGAPLTLAAAIQMADAKYPAIRAAEEQQQAAQSAIGVARTAYLPRADMLWQTSRSTTNRPNVAVIPQPIVPIPSPPARPVTGHSDWNSATGVLFAWQPFDFGERHAQVNVAKSGYELAQQMTALSRLDVASAAAGAFFDVVAARQVVAVQQANVDRMEVFSKRVHVLVDNTLRPGADASQADAQLALARTQLIHAQTQEQVRLEALANFLQVPAPQIVINDKGILGEAPSPDVAETAAGVHPAAQQEAALLDEQKEQIRALGRSYAPVFTLYGSASGLGAGLSSTSSSPTFEGGTAGLAPNTYNWMAAFEVTFPAFQIVTIHRQKQVQQAQADATKATYQQILGDLSAQAREARAMLNGARSIAQNTPVEVTAARESEQQQQARYKAGLATVIEVATAEATLAQAEGDDALARLNVWRGLAGVAEAQGDLAPFLQLLNKQP